LAYGISSGEDKNKLASVSNEEEQETEEQTTN